MWNYNDGFFEASFYNEEVSIESNLGPKQLAVEEGVLVYEYTMPSVHAHHFALYTKKTTDCGCYAPATNVIIETFHTTERPSDAALCTYFNHTVLVRKRDELPLNCPTCDTHWTPMKFYADTHYTNYNAHAAVKIGFSPNVLQQARAIFLHRAAQQTKLFVQQQTCSCLQEAGKISIECFDAINEETFLQQQFHVSLIGTPFNKQTFRCQLCAPAPLTWLPSPVRVGHFEKYTTFGIMYSTFLSQTLDPSVVYAVEPHIFMLAQQKPNCQCYEDVGQIETTVTVPLNLFTHFLTDEFNMHVTPLHNEPQMCCTACTQQAFTLP